MPPPLPASQTEFEAVPSTKPGPFLTQSPSKLGSFSTYDSSSRLGSFSAHDSTSQLVPQSDNSFNNEQLREQPSGLKAMYRIVEQLVAMDATERRALYQQRRQKMLSDKIDCAKFLTWFIENYPQSVNEVKSADDTFWKRFK